MWSRKSWRERIARSPAFRRFARIQPAMRPTKPAEAETTNSGWLGRPGRIRQSGTLSQPGLWPQPNYDPADLASNGTRLAAKCSAFFGSGSCHVSVFSESVFELLRFDVGTDLDGECVLGNWA